MKSTFVLNSLVLASVALADFNTYPKVPKSYTINGFADPIYDYIPDCAKQCVGFQNPTPCPDFDSGCFCVMPNWNALVAGCLVDKCGGSEVAQASSAIVSMCNRVGANTWAMPPNYSTSISNAINVKETPATTTPEATSSAPAATTPATSSAPEPVAPTTSSAPAPVDPTTSSAPAPITPTTSSAPVAHSSSAPAPVAQSSSAPAHVESSSVPAHVSSSSAAAAVSGSSSSKAAVSSAISSANASVTTAKTSSVKASASASASHSSAPAVEQANNAPKSAIGAIALVAALPLLI